MQTETWRPVVGFEGLYEVSNTGQVRRLRYRNRVANKLLAIPLVMKHAINRKRYHQVQLYKNGTRYTRKIHVLVLEAFVGPCPPGQEAAHYDDDASNNYVENLRWTTPAENSADRIRNGKQVRGSLSYNARLNEEQVKDILYCYDNRIYTQTYLAAKYGVALGVINGIVRRKAWKHVV